MKKNLIILAAILSLFITVITHAQQNIAVIGTGYVGLVSGAGLAEFGNTVVCADIDHNKITRLQYGEIPIYEPGLGQLVQKNVIAKRLSFTSDVNTAIKQADTVFIAVGTPMGEDGSANLNAVKSVVQSIARNMNNHKIICTKSTVPVGTGKWIRSMLEDAGAKSNMFDIVSNPEFLREGSAVEDFLHPDRIVLGTESEHALQIMQKIYQPLVDKDVPCVCTNIPTSETIKYTANAFLATKLSFINEIANFCDATGANIKDVAYALGLDKRISKHFLNPGPGFGGSCFPKDTQALAYMAQKYGIDMHMIEALIRVNKKQKTKPVEKLLQLMGTRNKATPLHNKTVAVLGLAFKNNTDDIRYSPAITTIELLLEQGARIKAYDPAATENMQQLFPNITYCSSAHEAATNADAIIIMTEWDEFRQLDLSAIRNLARGNIIIDARNMLDIGYAQELGFVIDTIGVPA